MRQPCMADVGDVYDVGSVTVDVTERRVSCQGRPIRLSPKTFDVLVTLVHRAGRLVTKRQLLEIVWHETSVDVGILTVHVAALRKVFGDCRTAPHYIETVSGYGYRLIAPVRRGSSETRLQSTF